ncbi:MAG: M48 family metalloprotease [Acidobacteriota bacterium]|nr:M48 family metalloprotease [Acidobacteriota bacterium]
MAYLLQSRAGRLLAAALLAGVAAACAKNPVTGSRELVFMSESQEADLGRSADAQIRSEMGVYEDAALQEYIARVGNELAAVSHRPDLPWQFAVIDSPVVNAFAVPGGYIYLTRGLLAYLNDEAELAGVLGHEIGHVTARHSVQAYSRAAGAQMGLLLGQIFVPAMRPRYGAPGVGDAAGQGLGLLFLKFGRDDERQADRLGAEYAVASGWDPHGVGDMLTTLGRIADTTDRRGTPNWLATHPEPADRVAGVAGTVETLLADTSDLSALRVDRAGYLARVDGIVYGDNPEQGVVRGREFLHPALRFALAFPPGWEVHNGAEMVIAREPGQERYMLLQIAQETGYDLQRIAEREMRGAGFVEVQATTTGINGLDAYIGTYTQDVRGVGPMIARVAFIRSGSSVYLFGAFADADGFRLIERDAHDSIHSFRQISRDEAERIRPNRLTLYHVQDGDTWQRIAQRVGDEIASAATLAIMNGYPVNEQPLPGDVVKVVQPGS